MGNGIAVTGAPTVSSPIDGSRPGATSDDPRTKAVIGPEW
jgi:hypothetical protein